MERPELHFQLGVLRDCYSVGALQTQKPKLLRPNHQPVFLFLPFFPARLRNSDVSGGFYNVRGPYISPFDITPPRGNRLKVVRNAI